ncbi:Sporulation kinase E [compost metagenome]
MKIGIKDTGPGMTEEVKQKIFEPFFTTKDVGEGTGLGLSIVFRIIENHHGQIDVITKVNHGTEFIITLPVTSR